MVTRAQLRKGPLPQQTRSQLSVCHAKQPLFPDLFDPHYPQVKKKKKKPNPFIL